MVPPNQNEFNVRLKNVTFITKKAVRIEQQFLYLQNSVQQKTIPKGIRTQCSFRCSIKDGNLQNLFDNMMQFSASRILDTLISYYQNWKNNLWSEHYQALAKHKKTMVEKDYIDLHNIVNNIIRKEKNIAQKTHTSKLARDKELGETYLPFQNNETAKNSSCTVLKTRKKRRKKVVKRKRPRSKSNKHKRKDVKCLLPSRETIPMETLQKSVINLSDRTLTREQLYVLYLGEGFAPTPGLPNKMKFNDDVIKWINSLRRSVHFRYTVNQLSDSAENGSDTAQKPLKTEVDLMERSLIKNTWKGINLEVKEGKCPALELFIKNVKQDIAKHSSSRRTTNPSNIDKKSIDALNEMRNWKDTVIRMFDKGTGFFILNKDDYIRRTMAELDNPSTYEVMESQQVAVNQCTSAITEWTVKYKDEIGMTDKLKSWILPSGKETLGNNYIDLKAHKPDKDFPGRLISTGCNTITRNLSELTAFEMKKVELKYNVKDNDDFLRRIDTMNKSGKLLNKKVLLCSFDIVSMFPNITKDLGLKNCRDHLNKCTNPIFSTDCILDAIEITLDNNITMFNGTIFRQKRGAAMGGSNSCDYADIALAEFDKIVHDHDLLFSQGVIPPLMFERFRDDCFVLFYLEHGVAAIIKFFEFCNRYHPSLRFTMTNPNTIGEEFLKNYVFIKDGILHTKPFSKECDSHSYLLPNSCHPLHNIKNIPHGIAHSVFKISSNVESYNLAKEEFSGYLKNRGYSEELISGSFTEIEKLNRDELIYKNKSVASVSSTRNYPLVCDFNPALPPVAKIINKYKYLLKLDDDLCKIIDPAKIFVSYRGNRKLKDLLVPSKLRATNEYASNNPHNKPIFGCFKCDSNCKLCRDFIYCPPRIKSLNSDQEFQFKHKLDCKSPNAIYLIDDLVCNKSSIGSTLIGMSIRWRNHKSHIKKVLNLVK